jgi:hypothetical protein
MGFDVEVEAREPGPAARPPGGVERDDARDALHRARRVGDPGGVLQQHRFDREPEAPGRAVEELAEAPGAIGIVDEEAWPVLDAQIEPSGHRGEARELRLLHVGGPALGAVYPDRGVRRRRPRARGGERGAAEREADERE